MGPCQLLKPVLHKPPPARVHVELPEEREGLRSPGSMAKLTRVAEKKTWDVRTHVALFMASVCLQTSKVSFMPAAIFELGPCPLVAKASWCKPEQDWGAEGMDLISSGSWSGCKQSSPLALFQRLWPIALHRKLCVNASVIPHVPQVFHFVQCGIKLLPLFQDLIEFYRLLFDGAFSWIF